MTPHEDFFTRELVRVDSSNETAWALLITNLAEAGRIGEVRQQPPVPNSGAVMGRAALAAETRTRSAPFL